VSNSVIAVASGSAGTELLQLVQDLIVRGYSNIIVVDDGCDDLSQPYFDKLDRQAGCLVVQHENPMGLMQSVKTGIIAGDGYFGEPDAYIAINGNEVTSKQVLWIEQQHNSNKNHVALVVNGNVKTKSNWERKLGSIFSKAAISQQDSSNIRMFVLPSNLKKLVLTKDLTEDGFLKAVSKQTTIDKIDKEMLSTESETGIEDAANL